VGGTEALGVGLTGTVPLELGAGAGAGPGGAPVGLGLQLVRQLVCTNLDARCLPVVADNRRGDSDRAGDGARAIRDGQSGGRGDGVGLGAVGDLSSLGAVGGVDINDLGGDGNVGVGSGTSGDGENGSDGELHIVGIRFFGRECRDRVDDV
jgi:hypothetical protein